MASYTLTFTLFLSLGTVGESWADEDSYTEYNAYGDKIASYYNGEKSSEYAYEYDENGNQTSSCNIYDGRDCTYYRYPDEYYACSDRNDKGKCTGCANGYYWKKGACVSSTDGCGSGYLEKEGTCFVSTKGCGENWKDLGGWCNRVRYTPSEAAKVLNEDNNTITLTFKK